MRQRRQHIRVTILPPNIFSTEVALGPGGSSGGEGELDCLSFWQILVPVFSSSCSLAQGAKGFGPHSEGHTQGTHVCTRWHPCTCTQRPGTHATQLTCIKLIDLPQRAVRVPSQSANERTQTCTLRQAQHSVHTHTYPPRSCFTSAPPGRPPTRGPCPIFSKPSTSPGPHPSLQEETALPRGMGLPHQHPLQTGSSEQSQAPPPYRSSRYFRYSEQSCWVPGLNQGVQDADRKFSGEMAGRCVQSGKDGSGAGGPLTSQLPAPQRAGPEGGSGESLPQTPSLPIHSQLSIPADFSHPTKSMPPKSTASGPWRGTVLQESVLPLFVAIPSA